MNKKKIILDSIFNIIASIIPIAVIQLIILPTIANKLGNYQYGIIITLISLISLFSHPFGNVLNNIRLLQNKEYEQNKIQGDFNLLLIIGICINSIVMIIGTIFYDEKITFINVAFIVIISGLNLLREYLIVTFRLTLNYNAILFNNLFLAFGYLIGFLLFMLTQYWQLIYICGYILSLLYIIKNSTLLKEKINRTILFKETSYKTIILFLSTFMGTAIIYADKLILYPLLGPNIVAVYYAATMIGKIISMGITPISGVFLSYLAKIEKLKIKNYIYIISFTGIVGVIGYFICIIFSRPVLSFLYPNLVDEAMKLIYITTASAVVSIITSVINPLILRFNNVNWQIIISTINFIMYIISTILFYNIYGLIGFCIGTLVANVVKLILMITILGYNLKKAK